LFSVLPRVSLKSARLLYIPPCVSEIDCWLSFTTIIRFDSISEPATFRPSKASPPDKEPSPIIAITFSFLPRMSLALASPVASEIEVDVCPILNRSCSLSSGLV